ncbi:hypothetical protein B0H34DRAFT_144144 [Crassisporium funariophilum]|nr:hypothetical protein B0H34DRAFT_144144 [Crassisporium funariophilum]
MARPHPYGIMVNEGNVHDIDVDDSDRWSVSWSSPYSLPTCHPFSLTLILCRCEYIFYRGLYWTSYARISRGIITIGQFVLPRHGHGVTNDTLKARYLRSEKEELHVDHWFPMEYYGDDIQGGVDGHYYHVFNTPLYYKISEGAIL